jgi:hypothetical protein
MGLELHPHDLHIALTSVATVYTGKNVSSDVLYHVGCREENQEKRKRFSCSHSGLNS